MPIRSFEELQRIAEGKRNPPLVAGVNVSVTSALRLGGLTTVDPKQFPLVQIRARMDACPFCSAMNGKVLRKDQHGDYLPPFHINCRCTIVHLTEGTFPVDFNPDEVQDLLKHAHFVADRVTAKRVRYEALEIPARVEGRDFIFRRVKDEMGRWVSKLEFRRPPDRRMPSFHLAGLMPPAGEPPLVSLRQLGRALRQLSPESFPSSVSSVVAPPADSPLVRQLEREGVMVKDYQGVAVINTARLMRELQRTDDKLRYLLTFITNLDRYLQ